jgi:hypothetical protein
LQIFDGGLVLSVQLRRLPIRCLGGFKIFIALGTFACRHPLEDFGPHPCPAQAVARDFVTGLDGQRAFKLSLRSLNVIVAQCTLPQIKGRIKKQAPLIFQILKLVQSISIGLCRISEAPLPEQAIAGRHPDRSLAPSRFSPDLGILQLQFCLQLQELLQVLFGLWPCAVSILDNSRPCRDLTFYERALLQCGRRVSGYQLREHENNHQTQ